MCLPLRAWMQKTIQGVETHLFSGKEIVLGTADSKEGDAEIMIGHEMTYHYWFI